MKYADYNGTSPLIPEVKEYLTERMNGVFANPNAIHTLGQQVNSALKQCRILCAEALGAEPEQIIFNSGTTEGVSQIFLSLLFENKVKNKILVSEVEHAAVLNSARTLAKKGFQIDYFKTNEQGKAIVDIKDDYDLVALMAGNNETGVIQDYEECAKICQAKSLPYLCDTTQIFGKIPFHFNKLGLDYAVLSGHKIGSLTGSGILLVKEPEKLNPMICGGGQEFGLRSGTQNYIGIECMTVAIQQIKERINRFEKVKKEKLEFEKVLKKEIPGSLIIGDQVDRLANTTLLALPGIHGQALQIELESREIFVTTSSACSDNEPMSSHVLKAMGLPEKIGRSVVRISVADDCSGACYKKMTQAIIESYNKLKKIENY